MVTLAVLALGLTAPRARAESTRAEVLAAIHLVENPRDVQRPGRHGELGAYQFRKETWRMHTDEPFAHALDRQASDAVAAEHYEWLRRGLERAGMPATPYNIALAWNGGLRTVLRGRAGAATRDYAMRVDNLVGAMESGRLANVR